jgi:ATP-dependent Clp protease ATP-binding subunit ClpA
MRFSQAARIVLQKAHEEAVRHGSSLIQPAHLLIALATEEHGMAGQVLHKSQITAEAILRLLNPQEQKQPDTINLSPAVQRTMEGAIQAAREWRSSEIGTTHLLASLLKLNDPFVQQVLQAANTTPEEIQTKLGNRKGGSS